MYAMEVFGRYKADAVTLNEIPYMGRDSVEVFAGYRDKGVFVLCRTSNPGAGEFQSLELGGNPLYRIVAQKALRTWNEGKNIGLVVGATALLELRSLREQFPEAWFLVPGIGAQGGDMDSVIKYGRSAKTGGLIINSSRAIIHSSRGPDFVKKARQVAEDMKNRMKIYFEVCYESQKLFEIDGICLPGSPLFFFYKPKKGGGQKNQTDQPP